jgi:hypothetical protein
MSEFIRLQQWKESLSESAHPCLTRKLSRRPQPRDPAAATNASSRACSSNLAEMKTMAHSGI